MEGTFSPHARCRPDSRREPAPSPSSKQAQARRTNEIYETLSQILTVDPFRLNRVQGWQAEQGDVQVRVPPVQQTRGGGVQTARHQGGQGARDRGAHQGQRRQGPIQGESSVEKYKHAAKRHRLILVFHPSKPRAGHRQHGVSQAGCAERREVRVGQGEAVSRGAEVHEVMKCSRDENVRRFVGGLATRMPKRRV